MTMRNSLKKGLTEILILCALSKNDMYGYQIAQWIAETSNHLITIAEGTLYPVLYRLSEKNYVSEREQVVNRRVRIYYHLESSGIEYFESCLNEYKNITRGAQLILEETKP